MAGGILQTVTLMSIFRKDTTNSNTSIIDKRDTTNSNTSVNGKRDTANSNYDNESPWKIPCFIFDILRNCFITSSLAILKTY